MISFACIPTGPSASNSFQVLPPADGLIGVCFIFMIYWFERGDVAIFFLISIAERSSSCNPLVFSLCQNLVI